MEGLGRTGFCQDVLVLSLENRNRKMGGDVGTSAIHTTLSFILVCIPYSQHNINSLHSAPFSPKNGLPKNQLL